MRVEHVAQSKKRSDRQHCGHGTYLLDQQLEGVTTKQHFFAHCPEEKSEKVEQQARRGEHRVRTKDKVTNSGDQKRDQHQCRRAAT